MQPPSVIGVFCEDVREEKTGQDTIIGILPDQVGLSEIPGSMGKFGIYLRLHLDAAGPKPKSIQGRLIDPSGKEIALPRWSDETIQRGFSEAAKSGIPLVGLLMKVVFGALHVPQEGLFRVVVNLDGTDFLAANFKASLGSPPNASAPPPLQSPPAAPLK
jgi:hypothetical protein